MATKPESSSWTVSDSSDLYNLPSWGRGYFSIDDQGRVQVHPGGDDTAGLDLRTLVDEVRDRGIDLPLLIRFSDILKARIDEIHTAFATTIDEYQYRGTYKGVYPIKVNQDRYIVERLVQFGLPHHFGLEAGSKPELLAVLAMLHDEEALIVCNGYKDSEYVETALLASKLGRQILLVLEKPSELPLVVAAMEQTLVRPQLGIRARLSTQSSGHWQESGGERSKFGFGTRELLDALAFLRERGLLDCLDMLHFHIGSQIPSIHAIKEAVREAARIYVELYKQGARLTYLDVGGGLGVDYDGSRTNSFSSTNYSLQEYANDVVAGVMEVCDPAAVPHPTLVSESGRAMVAHHAVLVVDVLGVRRDPPARIPTTLPAATAPSLQYLFEAYNDISPENLSESYHDLVTHRDDCLSLFQLGHLSLEARALAEDLFAAGCREISSRLADDEVPEELKTLEALLADIYFCNFSLFQSVPDTWAIDQLFPVIPLQRLDEEPTRRGILADVTCDSDGTIDRFVGSRDFKAVLELHELDQRPYYLGFFLVGAYQEILGDLHNLFGDTNTVNVSLDSAAGYELDDVIAGNSVLEVLDYVQYQREELIARIRRWSEEAIHQGRMTLQEARDLIRVYEAGLNGYTYPERD